MSDVRHNVTVCSWNVIIEEIQRLRTLGPDWDGEGSCFPTEQAVDCAVTLAQILMSLNCDPADRAFADKNGSVCIEFYKPSEYIIIEVDRETNISFWSDRKRGQSNSAYEPRKQVDARICGTEQSKCS